MKKKNLALFLFLLAFFARISSLMAAPLELQWTLEPHRITPGSSLPSSQADTTLAIPLVLDDGTAEGDFGVNGPGALQFLWFNHLTPPEQMHLEEIHVLFPAASAAMGPGDAVDLVVLPHLSRPCSLDANRRRPGTGEDGSWKLKLSGDRLGSD